MKKQKHYDFYLQCMGTGWLPNKEQQSGTGLCGAASEKQIDDELLSLFEPTGDESYQLSQNNQSTGWWGYEVDYEWRSTQERNYAFTTLRQTIVLFMACMAGEKF